MDSTIKTYSQEELAKLSPEQLAKVVMEQQNARVAEQEQYKLDLHCAANFDINEKGTFGILLEGCKLYRKPEAIAILLANAQEIAQAAVHMQNQFTVGTDEGDVKYSFVNQEHKEAVIGLFQDVLSSYK